MHVKERIKKNDANKRRRLCKKKLAVVENGMAKMETTLNDLNDLMTEKEELNRKMMAEKDELNRKIQDMAVELEEKTVVLGKKSNNTGLSHQNQKVWPQWVIVLIMEMLVNGTPLLQCLRTLCHPSSVPMRMRLLWRVPPFLL